MGGSFVPTLPVGAPPRLTNTGTAGSFSSSGESELIFIKIICSVVSLKSLDVTEIMRGTKHAREVVEK